MITCDMSRQQWWVISGKTHAISGGLHTKPETALEAAKELAKKEQAEALVVTGYLIVIPSVEVKRW